MRIPSLLTLGVLVVWVGVTPAQETIENPEFAAWAKFKKGTGVTIKSTTKGGVTNSEVILTTTLVDVGTDKLVLETSSVVKANGMEFKGQAAKRDVTRTTELPKGVRKEDAVIGKPPGTTEEGTETLKIAGTELKTKWYKYSAELAGTKTQAKMWVSDDVPGRVVRSEMTTTGAFNSTTTLEVIEFKKP
jgi:hypothetical protein